MRQRKGEGEKDEETGERRTKDKKTTERSDPQVSDRELQTTRNLVCGDTREL